MVRNMVMVFFTKEMAVDTRDLGITTNLMALVHLSIVIRNLILENTK
jgi:hypothetical protein